MRLIRRIPRLPRRRRESHKGDYGRVLVLAGSRGMVGAAALAGDAALRSGAGLVTIGTPASVYPILAGKVTCCTTRPLPETAAQTLSSRGARQIEELAEGFDVVALGPGLGRHPGTTRLVHRLASTLCKPVVMDADALNALAEKPAVLKRAPAPRILTPHPGEMARLLRGRALPRSREAQREIAGQFAARHGVILVLKGHRSIITDGERVCINPTGNPGMATGGTGDVLTGAIAGILGQGLDPFEATVLANYMHGLAGDLAARELGEVSLMASDVLGYLPGAFTSRKKR